MLIAIYILIVVGAIGIYFSPWIWRQWITRTVSRQVIENRMLVLTYDDGPSTTLTPRILDLLQTYNAKATFFVVGSQARQYPELLERILREGHEIGCHSEQHLNAWKTYPWRAVADIDAGYQTLSRWLPADGKFRPPHGKMTLPTYLSLRRRSASVWWWTIDSGDTHQTLPIPNTIENAVLKARGAIVLMHDMHTQDRLKERDAFVMETTAALLEFAKRESFVIAPLKQLSLCAKN
jgi:peptidoglycan-N-acetylglucosamine deacetylase